MQTINVLPNVILLSGTILTVAHDRAVTVIWVV